MDVTISAEKGTFLMVSHGGRFALVERRNEHLYSCHDKKRNGIPLAHLAGIAAIERIVDDEDWVDRPTAQAALDTAAARWTDLAEHMR